MTIDFINLYELLRTRGTRIGTLATAIEQGGICGWDRYDRFTRFPMDSPGASRALDALAAQAQHDDPDSLPPVDLDEDIYCSYGWPADELPDFAAIESRQLLEPERRKVNKKSETSTLAIVGGLLLTIRGELSVQPHPAFTSENQVIDFLSDELKDYPGMSRRNLQDKFAEAKKLIKMR